MASRSPGGRKILGPIPSTPTISRFACDRCMMGLTIPFSANCFEPDGSEYVVCNRLIDQSHRVVVYMHDNCTIAAKTAGPVVYASDQDSRGMILVAGKRSYTIEDIRVVMDGPRFLAVLPSAVPY